MHTLKTLLTNYLQKPQTQSYKVTHYIAIPAVILGTLILLSWISLSIVTHWYITFSWVAILLMLLCYYRINVRLAAVMTIILVILTLICTWIGYPRPTTFNLIVFIILFGGGWILLFIGQTSEEDKSFFTMLSQLLLGPLFLLSELLIYLKLDSAFDLTDFTTRRQ